MRAPSGSLELQFCKPCDLWVLKLFSLPCHPSGFPELVPVLMWNCWFRDPKQVGVPSPRGEGGQHTWAPAVCSGWGHMPVQPDSAEAIDASGTTSKSWMLFQTQDSFCAVQMHFLKKHLAGLVPPERIQQSPALTPQVWFQYEPRSLLKS